MSFYDWYCDLPPASPMTWGEQTDVPESADWFNAGFLILWGSNVPQTRTPDAHFYTEARYKGSKSVVVSPDYSEAAKFADLWLASQAGHRRGARDGDGTCHPARIPRRSAGWLFSRIMLAATTDMPMLVRLVQKDGNYRALSACYARRNSRTQLGERNNPEWKTVAYDEKTRGQDRCADRVGRIPLGREGEMEPRGERGWRGGKLRCG